MKKIVVSPKAYRKLEQTKAYIEQHYDKKTARRMLDQITATIRRLKKDALIGISVADQYGVETDFRKVFAAHNHIFYRIEHDTVQIVAIYHEKEDFLFHLFGISSVDEDSERYWDQVEREREGG